MKSPRAGKVTVHCWEAYTDEEGRSYTCLLDDSHEGDHAFTPDDEIEVEFA